LEKPKSYPFQEANFLQHFFFKFFHLVL
jgi:hypothetical protein